jgi:hypothetical protein
VSTSANPVGKNPTRGLIPNQDPTSETPAKSGNYGALVGLVGFFSWAEAPGSQSHTDGAFSWSGSQKEPDHETRPRAQELDRNVSADGCSATVKAALDRVDLLATEQPDRIKGRLAYLVAEYVSLLARAETDGNSEVLRGATLDLERNARDLIAGRGYDYELAPTPCPVCKGECRWCTRIGIVRCGACFPDTVARPAKYVQTR